MFRSVKSHRNAKLSVYCNMILLCGLLYIGCGEAEKNAADREGVQSYKRIVSMAPNITETLFALDLGDETAGVTKFCKYPPEAQTKPIVGGYLDPNYEAIASLNPDLVILLPEQEKVRTYLEELSVPCLTVHNRSVEEILQSIATIGEKCGRRKEAESLILDLKTKMRTVSDNAPSVSHPTILIVIERELGTGGIHDVYIAGKGTIYDELITIAGGRNAFTGIKIPYPTVSAEGLLELNPDIIIDLVAENSRGQLDAETVKADWNVLSNLHVVSQNAVYLIESDYAFIPGPRLIFFLEDIAKLVLMNAQ